MSNKWKYPKLKQFIKHLQQVERVSKLTEGAPTPIEIN